VAFRCVPPAVAPSPTCCAPSVPSPRAAAPTTSASSPAPPGSGLQLGCALAGFLLRRLLPDGPVTLVGDDNVDGRPGRRVYGKGRRRDQVRSATATLLGVTATRGSSWPSSSAFPSPPAPGHCSCWSICTAPRRRTAAVGGRTAPHSDPVDAPAAAADAPAFQGPPAAYWGSTRPSPYCSPPCPRPNRRGRSPGRARPA